MIVPDHILNIVIEGQTYFPGLDADGKPREIPDDVIARHPELSDPLHILNATIVKPAEPEAVK